MKLGEIAAAFGKGVCAGVAGTAAMTISSTVEMKLRDRPASFTPARAAAKVLGVEPVDEAAEARFSNIVHWGYGSGLLPARRVKGMAPPTLPDVAATGTNVLDEIAQMIMIQTPDEEAARTRDASGMETSRAATRRRVRRGDALSRWREKGREIFGQR